MAKCQVLIVDDHSIVRQGIKRLLEDSEDIEVIGQANGVQEAIDVLNSYSSALVLMDITMPGINGIQGTRMVKQQFPRTHVLILTMQDGDEYFFDAIRAGASGYVLKGASAEELINAVRAVNEGGVYLNPPLASKLVQDYIQRAGPSFMDGLSSRELEVLKLVAAGKTNAEIAGELFISENTVKTHRAHLMEKLNLRNRTELITYAIRKGLIAPEKNESVSGVKG